MAGSGLGITNRSGHGVQHIPDCGLFVESLDEVVPDGVIGQVVAHEPGYHRIKPAYILRDPLGGSLPHLRERYQGILLPGFGPKLSQKGRLHGWPIHKRSGGV